MGDSEQLLVSPPLWNPFVENVYMFVCRLCTRLHAREGQKRVSSSLLHPDAPHSLETGLEASKPQGTSLAALAWQECAHGALFTRVLGI